MIDIVDTGPEYGTEIVKCAKRACDWQGLETERIKQTLDSIVSTTLCPKCKCDTYRMTNTKPENSNAV